MVERAVITFDEVEQTLRTTKSEHEAKQMRDQIQRAFEERDELRKQLDAQPQPQQMSIFNINDEGTRNVIMMQLGTTAPPLTFNVGEVSVTYDGGKVTNRTITLNQTLGSGPISVDEAEAVAFGIYNLVVRARAHHDE